MGNDAELVNGLVGREFVHNGCPNHKVMAVVCWGKPKNNFDRNLTFAICKTDRGYIQLAYREVHKGCGDYKWLPDYPYEIDERHIKVNIMSCCWGGWDNGQGEPVWVDESYNK